MKRIWIAVILLAIIFTIAFALTRYLLKITDTIEKMLQQINNLLKKISFRRLAIV